MMNGIKMVSFRANKYTSIIHYFSLFIHLNYFLFRRTFLALQRLQDVQAVEEKRNMQVQSFSRQWDFLIRLPMVCYFKGCGGEAYF